MRIIVCPHDMGMGGSQINALDLATSVRDRGNEVLVYAPPGPLVKMAADRGLAWCESSTGLRLSARWSWGLLREAKRFKADLIHTYEWAPSVGAAFGPHLLSRIPQIMTVLSMEVPHFLPHHLDLVVGTEKLASTSEKFSRRHVLEPPIDTSFDVPGTQGEGRARLGIAAEDFVVTIVGRVTTDLDKTKGIIAAIRALDSMERSYSDRGGESEEPRNSRCTLIIAGDGSELRKIQVLAEEVNARHERQVVRCVGNLSDPRPAYLAADVVVGMGSSILRGMATGRASVVLGADGFCLPVDESNLPTFLWQGFFGSGRIGGADTGYTRLLPELKRLRQSEAERRRLGQWSRQTVVDRFSLDRASEVLESLYKAVERSESKTGLLPVGRTRAKEAWRKATSLGRSGIDVASFVGQTWLKNRVTTWQT